MLKYPYLFILLLSLFPTLSASAFEICDAQNDYLELSLPAFSSYARSADLPIACVEAAQLTLATTGYYGYCANDNGRPGRTHPRPCISENYVGSVYNALLDVSECLNYNPRWAFAVLNLESALHINAVGAATDIGIGQLTTTAINDINLNALPKAKRIARASSLDSCKRIVNFLYDGATDLDQRCSFISVPNNPLHDLSFSVLLLKRNLQLLEGYFNRWNMVLPPAVGLTRVKTLLSMLGYNAGVAGVASTLRSYLGQMPGPLTDAHFDFENRDADSFVTFVQQNFPAKDDPTRTRVSKYVGYILKSVRNTEKTLTPGLCTDADMQIPLPPIVTRNPHKSEAGGTKAQIAVEIETYMVELAKDYTQLHTSSVQDCERLKAEFIYAFAPGSNGPQQLPETLLKFYKQLCSK